MKQKLLLIVIVVFLTAAAVIIIGLNPSKNSTEQTTEATNQTSQKSETLKPTSSEKVVEKQAPNNKTTELPVTQEQTETTVSSTTDNTPAQTINTIETPNSDLWQRFEPSYQPEIFSKYQQSSVDRRYFKFSRSAISEAKTGDTISFFIPQSNRSFYIAVEDIETYRNGDITLNGWTFDEQGIRRPVTITQGAKGTFGNIATPEGTYTIEAVGDTGWIAPTNDIRNQQDFRIPDYVVPKFDPDTGKLITAP